LKRRQDDGITDGTRTQFAKHNRREATAELSLADQPITGLRDYSDVVTFTPDEVGAVGNAITYIDVHPSLASDGKVIVNAVRELDFIDLFADEVTEQRAFQLEAFFTSAYQADLDLEDVVYGSEARLDIVPVSMTELAPEGLSRRDAYDHILDATKLRQLNEDVDDLPKKFRQFLEAHAVISDPGALRAADDITIEYLDTAMALRLGEREISDAQAIAIARRMDADTYPVWSEFGKTGVADKQALHDELFTAYSNEWGRKRDWANMMFTYLLHGGDND
jgi:hypothetical protein